MFSVHNVLLEEGDYFERKSVIIKNGKLRFYPLLKRGDSINDEMIQFTIDCSSITEVLRCSSSVSSNY